MMHPALSESHELPFDVYENAFDWFFGLDEFEHWLQKDRLWQLRCVGGPGSGKTTLSALVVAQLQEKFKGRDEAVASIFLQDNVNHSKENDFCEAVLNSVYLQLSTRHHDSQDLANYFYKSYGEARAHGKRRPRHLLRKALSARLAMLEHAFLVVDDIDRCYEGSLLESELSRLQIHGLKIMTTSRVPLHTSMATGECDTDVHKDDWYPQRCKVYWWCENCKDENYIICHSCKDEGHTCKTCGHAAFLVEPYDHIDLEISLPEPALSAFIAFSLESNHGDLALHTSNLDKPPVSPLGTLIRKHNGGSYARTLVESIVRKAEGNIGFARLLLELVHEAHSIEEIESSAGGAGDRLPQRVVDYFDTGVEKIQERTDKAEGNLGLKSIAVAATGEDCCWKTFDEVRDELEEGNRNVEGPLASVRVVDDVIRAANGFLVQMRGEDQCVAPYNEYFSFYVRQNYNAALFWEHSLMKTHHSRKQSRTAEFAGMGKTNTAGAGKLLRMRKHIRAVSRLLKNKKEKVNLREYAGFKLKRRITGKF